MASCWNLIHNKDFVQKIEFHVVHFSLCSVSSTTLKILRRRIVIRVIDDMVLCYGRRCCCFRLYFLTEMYVKKMPTKVRC